MREAVWDRVSNAESAFRNVEAAMKMRHTALTRGKLGLLIKTHDAATKGKRAVAEGNRSAKAMEEFELSEEQWRTEFNKTLQDHLSVINEDPKAMAAFLNSAGAALSKQCETFFDGGWRTGGKLSWLGWAFLAFRARPGI